MYKRDYHPDENLIFETEHYKFPVSKSTTEDPDLARTVKIDEALYDEAKVRLNEDTKLNKKIDDETKKAKRKHRIRNFSAVMGYCRQWRHVLILYL